MNKIHTLFCIFGLESMLLNAKDLFHEDAGVQLAECLDLTIETCGKISKRVRKMKDRSAKALNLILESGYVKG